MSSIGYTCIFKGCMLVRIPAPPPAQLTVGVIKPPEPGATVEPPAHTAGPALAPGAGTRLVTVA